MAGPALLAAAAGLCGVGAVVALAGTRRLRRRSDAVAYLQEIEAGFDPALAAASADEFGRRLAEPLVRRLLRPAAGALAERVHRLTPRGHLAKVRKELVLAGLEGRVRAEELVTLQVLLGIVGLGAALAFSVAVHATVPRGTLLVVLLSGAGLLGPRAFLKRRVAERQGALRRDLPDVADLLAISVEAGTGFEGAMQVVCQHFRTPLAGELDRTLKEMELGLARREALQNLRRRTNVPELASFVLALTQADALGMPLGRVLHAEAAEMRTRRRQLAREQAGKLPVKILFPLVVFIFPAIFVVVLGPAAVEIAKALRIL